MAVIVLSGADFSNNNIGSIVLKKALLTTTKEILSRYNITIDEEAPMQIALNDFVSDMISAGLIGSNGKIKALCLPFLADSLTSAQINALDGSNFFAANLGNGLTFTNKGLKPVQGNPTEKANHLKFASLSSSYHYAGYNITAEASDNAHDRYIFGTNGNILGLQKYDNNQPTVLLSQGSKVRGDVNYKFASCLLITNITPSSAILFTNGQKTFNNSPSYQGASVSTNPIIGDYAAVNYSADCSKASWSLLSIGEVLSDAESINFNNAVNKLMAIVATL